VEHGGAGVSGHHGAEIEYILTDPQQVLYMRGHVVYMCVSRQHGECWGYFCDNGDVIGVDSRTLDNSLWKKRIRHDCENKVQPCDTLFATRIYSPHVQQSENSLDYVWKHQVEIVYCELEHGDDCVVDDWDVLRIVIVCGVLHSKVEQAQLHADMKPACHLCEGTERITVVVPDVFEHGDIFWHDNV